MKAEPRIRGFRSHPSVGEEDRYASGGLTGIEAQYNESNGGPRAPSVFQPISVRTVSLCRYVWAVHRLILPSDRLVVVWQSSAECDALLGQGVVELKKGLQGIEDDVKDASNEERRSGRQPQVRDEVKPSEVEAAQR